MWLFHFLSDFYKLHRVCWWASLLHFLIWHSIYPYFPNIDLSTFISAFQVTHFVPLITAQDCSICHAWPHHYFISFNFDSFVQLLNVYYFIYYLADRLIFMLLSGPDLLLLKWDPYCLIFYSARYLNVVCRVDYRHENECATKLNVFDK